MTRRVLVSGAGVAGTALAHWLTMAGWQVTVVERAAQVRNAGQNVDIRGAGREVVRRMGLEDRLLAEGTGEVGTRFVDSSGRPWAEFPAGQGESDGATAEMEILRGTLAEVLIEHSARAQYVFGDSIESVTQDADVTFESGDSQSYDAVPSDSVPDALQRYEQRMRPFVKNGQKVPSGGPRLAHPRTRLGVLALRAGAAAVASRPVRAVAAFASGRSTHPSETFTLPDYPTLTGSATR